MLHPFDWSCAPVCVRAVLAIHALWCRHNVESGALDHDSNLHPSPFKGWQDCGGRLYTSCPGPCPTAELRLLRSPLGVLHLVPRHVLRPDRHHTDICYVVCTHYGEWWVPVWPTSGPSGMCRTYPPQVFVYAIVLWNFCLTQMPVHPGWFCTSTTDCRELADCNQLDAVTLCKEHPGDPDRTPRCTLGTHDARCIGQPNIVDWMTGERNWDSPLLWDGGHCYDGRRYAQCYGIQGRDP